MEITSTMKIDNEELKDLFGLQKKEPQKVKVRRKSNDDPYIWFFDEDSSAWTKDPEMNKMFLVRQQAYANEKLKYKGHLFLNEVLDMLGLPRTRAGQVIGWVYDERNPIGDNFVDFGLYERCNRKFVNGLENSVLLNFNVDGNILDYFGEEP